MRRQSGQHGWKVDYGKGWDGYFNAIPVRCGLADGTEVLALVGESEGRFVVRRLEIVNRSGDAGIGTDALRGISIPSAIRTAQDSQGWLRTRDFSHFDREATVRLTRGGGFDLHAEIAWLHLQAWDNDRGERPHVWLAEKLTKRRGFTTPEQIATLVYQARHRYKLLAPTAPGGRQRPEPTGLLLEWARERDYLPKRRKKR